MKRKLLSGLMLTLFLLCILVSGYKIKPARSTWTGTVYIRADGSIDPPDAPIVTYDNITYTLTDNITSQHDGIVIERDNIVIDGAEYSVDGPRAPPYTGFPYKGINLNGKNNVTIRNINVQEFGYGIWLYNSSKVRIYGNRVANNYLGIHLESSSNTNIVENDVRDCIQVRSCSDNIVSENNLMNTYLYLYYSSENNVTANIFNSSEIIFQYSNSNFIYANTFFDGGFSFILDSYGNVVMDNLVNNKPLVYLEGISDVEVENAGQVILINCTRIRIQDLNLSRTTIGLWLWRTTNATISRNIIQNNRYGIYLTNSSYNTIAENDLRLNEEESIVLYSSSNYNTVSGNTIANNNGDGISITRSMNNIVLKNIIIANSHGICLGESHNNIIFGNNVTANAIGIELTGGLGKGSSNNVISGNNVTKNSKAGIELSPGFNNSIIGNLLINDGLVVELESYRNLVEDNLVNGKPLVYLEGISNSSVEAAGQIILINCNNITIEDLNLSNTDIGIQLWRSSNININGNNITANDMEGIRVYYSSNTKISRNNITANNGHAITFYGTNSTIIGNIISGNSGGGIGIGGSCNVISDNNITANNGDGVNLSGTYNLVSTNKIATNADNGIRLAYDFNIVLGNNITGNAGGVYLHYASNNTILKNTIADNDYGIRVQFSNNSIYQNNFVNNLRQVYFYFRGYVNFWDNGYPFGGNYWSDYSGIDFYSGSYQNETGSDGIGDAPYVIDENNLDNYPLMGPVNVFDAGVWDNASYTVDIISNSTISDFEVGIEEGTIKFNLTGTELTSGFCRVTVPNIIVDSMWENNYTVLIDGKRVETRNWTDVENTYIYFNYEHSIHEVTILKTYTTFLYISASEGGGTEPSVGSYTFLVGDIASVLAIPYKNYVFDHWELDGVNVGSTNPIDVLMTTNHTLHAVFLQTYNLTIATTIGGTTNPPPGTFSYAAGTTLNVTAIPDAGYSFDYWLLDGQVRTENPISILMDSNHTLEAYFIDDIKPDISDPWQDPPPDNVQPFQNVTVWVNVTDYGSGIKNVTLWCSLDNGTTWEPPINMTALPIPSDTTITYEATIPGYENCTWITYKIIAYDNAGNNATKDNNGYGYKYHVIPEFPSALILPLFMIFTLAVFVLRKKRELKHGR